VVLFLHHRRRLPDSLLDRLFVHAIDGNHLGRRRVTADDIDVVGDDAECLGEQTDQLFVGFALLWR
jgi:hypothetical protein